VDRIGLVPLVEGEAHAPREGAERPRKEPGEDVYLAHLRAYGRVARGEKRRKGEKAVGEPVRPGEGFPERP